MKKITIILITILSFITNNPVFAEDINAKIFGHVVSNGEHIPYATIVLKGTTVGTASDYRGHYNFTNLPKGTYILKVSAVGFKSKEIEIIIKENLSKEIDFDLEEDAISLNQVVVSANRNETTRKDAAVIVNTFGIKMFENTNSTSVADGMSFQPGLRLETNCQNCGFQQVRINGLDGPYSQILIDSRPIFSALSGVYGIEQIPVSMVERVEVVRGGGSALFGSNAIGGTINIITKEPTFNSFQLSSKYSAIDKNSSDVSFDMNTSIVTEDRKAGLSLFGSTRTRDYYDADGDGFSEISLLDNSTFGFRSYYKPTNYTKIALEYHKLNEYRRGGNQFEFKAHESDIAEEISHNVNAGGLTYTILSKNYKSKIAIFSSLQKTTRNSYYGVDKDINAYGNTYDFAMVTGTQYNYAFDKFIFSKSDLTAGIEYQLNTLEDKMPGYNRSLNQEINIYSLFAQNEWKTEKVNVLLGARLDKHNLIETPIISPRANILYKIFYNTSARFTYAKGFRAPQAFDEDLHIGAVGGEVHLIKLADNLKTETSHSFSGSFDFYTSIFGMETNFLVEGFYTNLSDVFVLEEIGTDATGNQLLERKNASGAEVYGVNTEARVAISSIFQGQAGFTVQRSLYLNPEQWSNDETIEASREMLRTPNTYGYFTLSSTPIPRLDISLSAIYTGEMYVPHYAGFIEKDALETSDDFLELNFKIAKKIAIGEELHLELSGGVQNILNSYQSDFDLGVSRDAGYIYGPSRPRIFFIGLKMGNIL